MPFEQLMIWLCPQESLRHVGPNTKSPEPLSQVGDQVFDVSRLFVGDIHDAPSQVFEVLLPLNCCRRNPVGFSRTVPKLAKSAHFDRNSRLWDSDINEPMPSVCRERPLALDGVSRIEDAVQWLMPGASGGTSEGASRRPRGQLKAGMRALAPEPPRSAPITERLRTYRAG